MDWTLLILWILWWWINLFVIKIGDIISYYQNPVGTWSPKYEYFYPKGPIGTLARLYGHYCGIPLFVFTLLWIENTLY